MDEKESVKKVFEYVDINFYSKDTNGFRISKSWKSIDKAIEELTRMKENIVVKEEL